MESIKVVNLHHKMSQISGFWKPGIVGELNDTYLKLARLKGEFIWHQHEQEDELFMVLQGRLVIKLRDGDLVINPGEFAIIPHGVEHKPVADEEVQVLLLEPKSTLNTGNVQNDRTVEAEWI